MSLEIRYRRAALDGVQVDPASQARVAERLGSALEVERAREVHMRETATLRPSESGKPFITSYKQLAASWNAGDSKTLPCRR